MERPKLQKVAKMWGGYCVVEQEEQLGSVNIEFPQSNYREEERNLRP